jgi:hypothetical protein
MKKLTKKIVSKAFAKLGFSIVKTTMVAQRAERGYIPTLETVAAAQRRGLSVCDYVEDQWRIHGNTERVVDQMASGGMFAVEQPFILEIGAGTGRYIEKVLARCAPVQYESYETAPDWADWLQKQYPIISREADGVSLKQTPALSIDILHANGVFVYLPFLVAYSYWMEMFRVVKNGGWVAFDIISEACMDEQTAGKWLAKQIHYPCFISKDYVISLFARKGFVLKKSFMSQYGEGQSEYLVFRRQDVLSFNGAN